MLNIPYHKETGLYKDNATGRFAAKPWSGYYQDLKALHAANGGSLKVVQTQKTKRLFKWAAEQRRNKQHLTSVQIELLDQLGFDWETKETKLDNAWNAKFALLQEFHQKHGHTRLIRSHRTLGMWVANQRTRYRKGVFVRRDRIEKLESIGFEWCIGKARRQDDDDDGSSKFIDKLWNQKFNDLCAFMKSHPRKSVPDNYMVSRKMHGNRHEEYNLSRWVRDQRRLHREGRLKRNRRKQLESIDFAFDDAGDDYDDDDEKEDEQEDEQDTVVDKEYDADDEWDSWFGKLVDFKAKNGSCNVPSDKDPQLSSWVSEQRARKEANDLSSVQFQKLACLGCFRVDQWTERLGELRALKRKHGHCRIRYDTSSGGPLEKWANDIRHKRKLGTLDPEQMAPLNKLGFEWHPPGLPISCDNDVVHTAKRKTPPSIEMHAWKKEQTMNRRSKRSRP